VGRAKEERRKKKVVKRKRQNEAAGEYDRGRRRAKEGEAAGEPSGVVPIEPAVAAERKWIRRIVGAKRLYPSHFSLRCDGDPPQEGWLFGSPSLLTFLGETRKVSGCRAAPALRSARREKAIKLERRKAFRADYPNTNTKHKTSKTPALSKFNAKQNQH
jgi:hypothetical protein